MSLSAVELPGSVSLVTGAGHGIGRATALALAEAGSLVLVTDVNGEAAEKVAVECMEVGAEAESHSLDVADGAAVAALAELVHTEHGPLDVLVNNAGVGMSARFLDMTEDDWDWILGVNLRGVINGCRAFGRPMTTQGKGHVVNISSALGYTPRATEPAYVTTKAAVLALSRSLRADWRAAGVGVSAVCPGVIDTGIIDRTRFRGARAEADTVDRVQRVFRRGHAPEKVAAAVLGAVEHDRAVVPVGWEARLGWWFSRLGPLRAQERLARQERI